VTQPTVPTFDTNERLTATKLNQLGAAVGFTQAVDGTYTPTLTATGGTPNIGASGYLNGVWWRTSNHLTVIFDVSLAGAGVSIVGSSWRISLPFNADLTLHPTGALNAPSHVIGNFQTQSPTSAEVVAGSIILSAVAEMIFYATGSSGSIGSAAFTGASARFKGTAHYVADPTLF
jgi:hypothetical protein